MMNSVTWLGLLAGCCTTFAYLPQVIRTWRTRSTHDISLGMFSLMMTGIALWLGYGVLIGDLPIVVANVISFALAGTILVLKLKHG